MGLSSINRPWSIATFDYWRVTINVGASPEVAIFPQGGPHVLVVGIFDAHESKATANLHEATWCYQGRETRLAQRRAL
jgi:hypothetical protein